MRILLLINSFRGLVSFRKEVVSAILGDGHEVLISGPKDDNAHILEEMGCKLINTGFNRKGTNPLKDLLLILQYIKMLRRENPDVVLTYTIKPNLYGGLACRLCGVRQVANVTGLGLAVENPGLLQRITVLLYRLGLKKAYKVFFQNKANMDFCRQRNMVGRNIKLIPGSGVNLKYHSMQDYPSPDEPCRFIFISRIIKEKGIEEYLSAAMEIKKIYPEVEFHILGSSEEDYAERVKQLQEEGIIIYHGRQPDVRPYLGKIHCTVHPSFYPEGMSNVLLESCAAGRPIITTDRPGCGEIVDDGVNGFIVRQRDSVDLVNIIDKFIRLTYEQKLQMSSAARKKVEKEFDRNIVVKAYLDVINSIAHV